MAVIVYRLSSYFYARNIYVVSKLLTVANMVLFSTEISPRSRIGGGLVLLNAQAVLVHDRAVLGRNCTLMHHTSVGVQIREDTPPDIPLAILEDDVVLGFGARIVGSGTIIGAGCHIEPNALVLADMPPGSRVGGNPAQALGPVASGESDFSHLLPVSQRSQEDKTVRPTLGWTFRAIEADFRAKALIEGMLPGLWTWLCLFFDPSVMVVQLFRLQAWAWGAGLRPLAWLPAFLIRLVFKSEFSSDARIGKGLVLQTSFGVFVGRGVRLGESCVLSCHVTLAAGFCQSNGRESIELGDGVLVGVGARIRSGVTVGNCSLLGAGVVVDADVPEHGVVVGNPSRLLPPWTEAEEKRIRAAQVQGECAGQRPTLGTTLGLIRQDVATRAWSDGRESNAFYWLKLLINPGGLSVVCCRFQRWLYGLRLYPLSGLLRLVGVALFTVDISPKASIGGGLVVIHPNCVFVSDRVALGEKCILSVGVCIASGWVRGRDDDQCLIQVGDGAFFGAGVRIIGNLRLGDNVVVGANGLVRKDAPDNAVLVGVPARTLMRNVDGGPSATSGQDGTA
ncbi:MAG: DapH/DapD/GlmU-related protein [Desulfovibrionaceae bacterium]